MAQDHLLQADAGAEAQRARAQPADRPGQGRQLKDAHPLAVHAHSAWIGPSRRPSARAARAVIASTSASTAVGSRDGVAYSVSSKYGPSSGSGSCRRPPAPPDGLRAAAPRSPPPRRAGSSPAAAAPRAAPEPRPECSGRARRSSAPARRRPPGLPRDCPTNTSGLTTQGRPTSRATAATSAPEGTSAKRGLGAPTSADAPGASPPCHACARRPPAGCGAVRGARRPGRRPSPPGRRRPRPRRTGSPGHARRSARPPRVGSDRRRVSARSPIAADIAARRSDATVTAAPSSRAAAKKSGAR